MAGSERSKGLRMSPSVGRCAVKFLVVVYNDNRNSITTYSAKTRNLFRKIPVFAVFSLYFPSVFTASAILRYSGTSTPYCSARRTT